MLNLISLVVILITLFLPLQSFGQDSDSVVTTLTGISQEEVKNQLEALSNELNSKYTAREDSLKMLQKSEIDSLTQKLSSKHLLILDSLRSAITQELTDIFEEEKKALTESRKFKMSSSRSSDSETAKNYFGFIKLLVESGEKDLFDDAIIEMDNFKKLYWTGKIP